MLQRSDLETNALELDVNNIDPVTGVQDHNWGNKMVVTGIGIRQYKYNLHTVRIYIGHVKD